jgi:hypothetical protein
VADHEIAGGIIMTELQPLPKIGERLRKKIVERISNAP